MPREDLIARAEALGIKFPKNISDAKLAEKIDRADSGDQEELYVTRLDVRHNGETFEAGDTIPLVNAEAAPLLACGAVEPLDP